MLRKWTQQSIHLIAAILGIVVPFGAAFMTPAVMSARTTPGRDVSAERAITERSSSNYRGRVSIGLFRPSSSTSGAWTTYLADADHDGFNSHETLITPTSAPHLRLKWFHPATNGISDQPIESDGIVYWGSWDGNMHATSVRNNARVWTTFIGRTTDSSCDPPGVGVASSPTLGTVNAQLTVFVGGGDASVYALNADTGKILWRTTLGSSPSHFIWDSPTIFGTSIYIGTSSFGDCPLVQSKLFQLDITTGHILNTFPIVPNGCTGGGIWGSPTVDTAAGNIFITTGNSGSCRKAELNAFALLELKAANLSFVKRHQLPPSERPGDSDFGYTPGLFTASIGGVTHSLVGVANKNGKYYAFDRANISANAVWTVRIAKAGSCPQCGSGSISPAAWDGSWLYIGGGNTIIGGRLCRGSVRKVDPGSGKFIWSHCMNSGPVLGSVTAVGATTSSATLIAVSEGNSVIVMNASTGDSLARLSDGKAGSMLFDGPTIADGVLYVGNIDGNLYAYSVDGA